MKKLLFTLVLGLMSFVLCPTSLNAQTIPPPFINYQAVLYDVNGPNPNSPLVNQSFSTFVNINDELGNLLYREEHYASTDANGLITVKMGDGVYIAGPITNFNLINWGVGKYYLVVDFDINGTISSTAPEQLVTVPYSFYAGNAGNGMTAVADNGNGTLTFTYANGATYTTPTLAGIQGPAGPVGPSGASGATGADGQSAYDLWLAQGNTGTVQDFLSTSAYQIWLAQGNTGTAQDFLNTLVGPSGPQGIQGLPGTNGATGAQGPQGPQGVQGVAGPSGASGTAGPAGAQGLTGPNGRSAYEIAVLNGFVGTETQWLLSLVGATGPSGASGTAGATGPQGPAGNDGATGPQGPIGLTGPQGLQGIQGPVGNDGATGPQGPTGNDGATGPQGPIGLTGPQGAQGLLDNGTAAGNTPYWNGSQWVVNGTNFYNNGGSLGVGTVSPDPSSKLEVSSTTQGFLPPRLTSTQRNAIVNPANGLQIFNLTTGCINYWFNTMWYEWCGTPISTASITALNCGSTSITGTLTSGTAASGVSASVPYTGGNGGSYTAQTISSTGVSGLTATLTAGILANGSGSLSFAISGTPATSGTASFALTIGGQSCSILVTVATLAALYPANSVFCASGPTAIVDVTNPTTGKTWMDRNLGASQVATSSTDANAYGDLYQWGRRSDGHQCRTSATTSTLSTNDQPTNGNFIININPPYDWRNPQNNNLWQGAQGINNPCPNGYRVPTDAELEAERISWSSNNSIGAFASPLKLVVAGYRYDEGGFFNVDIGGYYWSSAIDNPGARLLGFTSSDASVGAGQRADAWSLRCIKETVATLGALNCGSATTSGNVYSGQATSGVSTTVPYTGGNGGYYAAQSVSSTVVTGLTASLAAGTLANGSGNLMYTITGTASVAGTATFAITIGGQSCSFSVTVATLTSQYPANSVFCASGPTAIVDVTNPTTGKIWMDRNLGASQVATSSTDAAAYGDLYQWGRGSDGHQCRTSATTATLSSSDTPGNASFILAPNAPNDWRTSQNANLWQGISGINNPCPTGYRIPTETELNAERLSWSANTSVGAFASPLKVPLAGSRDDVNGSLGDVGSGGRYWSSAVSGTNSRNLYFVSSNAFMNDLRRAIGGSVRCIKDASAIPATLGALNCVSTSVTGTLTSGTAASGVSASVPYTGGNGGSYTAQTISSTGVTGLTATLTAGTLANGAGSLSFAISGTPATSGTASFALTIGGQSCSFAVSVQSALAAQYPANSVFCASGPTAIVDVTNPTTGKIWMDRNLGASQVATSSTDAAAYGDLYQWGRGNDGHQCRTSATTATLSSTDTPGNGNHILAPNAPNDWRSPQNANLWQGVNGVNNPCPAGYRVPTDAELDLERLSWSVNTSVGAFASPLKLPMAGRRDGSSGSLLSVGSVAYYWSSSISGTYSRDLSFGSSLASMGSGGSRAGGVTLRCIKDASAIPATLGAINCGSTSVTGTLTSGTAASSVSASVPYTGGNSGSYAAQTISSTGVTGLIATLTAGILGNGSGSLSFAISGTPASSGTASFALTIGGQSCSFTVSVQSALVAQYPANSVFCASGPTAIVDVTSPTGKIWMDRNLGASQAATSSTDAAAYGDLYQWGRRSDGHQCRNSPTTTTLSITDQPAHGSFIIPPGNGSSNYDWRSPQNNNLWQGVNGINNPCPNGYRLPTETEFNTERLSWTSNNSMGAFNTLKLVHGGFRSSATLLSVGGEGRYWFSTVNISFFVSSGDSYTDNFSRVRAEGLSVRCIKN